MSKRSIGVLSVSAAMLLSGTGCATLLSGTQQKLAFRSAPSGAYVKFAERSGTTPVTMMVDKGDKGPVELIRGNDRRLVYLERKVDPATWLNLIPPLWPGFIVDAVTGAMTKYDAEVITMDFDNNEFKLTRFNE